MARVDPKQLTPGTNGQVLTTVAGVPAWAAAGGGGVTAVGSPSITKMEPISLTGPASYVAGGFTATFSNLTTLQRAIICLIAGTVYKFIITAKATNQATIKAYRATPAHTHTFTGVTHTHSFTGGSHTHVFTGTAHGHTLTMDTHTHAFTGTAHGHSFVLTGAATTLGVAMAASSIHIPSGNPTRTVAAGGATGVQNTASAGTNASVVATGTNATTAAAGTNASTAVTGSNGNTVADGTNASVNTDAMEELGAGVNLSGVTLELIGFGA